MFEKILDVGKIFIDSWDKLCHWYVRKKYEIPSVAFIIRKETLSYGFFIKNMSNEPVSISKINTNLKVKYSDNKWRSKQGDEIYTLIFKESLDLTPWAEERLKSKIFIANKRSGEECWLDGLWSPHSYGGNYDVVVEFKDKFGRLLKTESKVSWTGHSKRNRTEHIKQ